MELKKLVLVFLLVGMLSAQPIFAASSEIKVTDDWGNPINEVTVHKGDPLFAHAMLYVGNEWRGLRLLEFYIINENGNILGEPTYDYTNYASGIAWARNIPTNQFQIKDYTLKVRYSGSPDGEWPEAETRIPIHVVA